MIPNLAFTKKTVVNSVMDKLKIFFAFLLLVALSFSSFGQSTLTKGFSTLSGTPVRGRTPVDLLIVGGTVVTMNAKREIIEDGAIAIRRGEIVSIGKRAEIAVTVIAKRIINAAGKVVIPGLINTHTHAAMSLFRGISDDLDLQDWLTKYIFPAEAKNVTEAFVRAGTRLGMAEMIRGGTTTYCDMNYFEDAIADESKKAGVRGG